MTNEEIEKRFKFELEMGMFKVSTFDRYIYLISKYKNSRKWILKLSKILRNIGYCERIPDIIKNGYEKYNDYLDCCDVVQIDVNHNTFNLIQRWIPKMHFIKSSSNFIPDYIGFYRHKEKGDNLDD